MKFLKYSCLVLVIFFIGVQAYKYLPSPTRLTPTPCENKKNELIILFHGLGRFSWSMSPLKKYFLPRGYDVLNVGYPSKRFTLDELVQDNILPKLKEYPLQKYRQIHFISHSLGGIIIREIQSNFKEQLGHSFLLAPPNQGSEVADFFNQYSLTRYIIGPVLSDLTTTKPTSAQPVNAEVTNTHILMGTNPIPIVSFLFFTNSNDGLVSLESSKMKKMASHTTFPFTHAFIMGKEPVLKTIEQILEN